MTMDNDWKDSLRERFSEYSVPEPVGLWEGIEQGMAGKPRRKILPVWIASGLAAAAAVVLAVVLFPEKVPESPVNLEEPVRYVESAVADPVVTDDSVLPENQGRALPAAVRSRRTLLAEAEPVTEPSGENPVNEAIPDMRRPEETVEVVPGRMQPEQEQEQDPSVVPNGEDTVPDTIPDAVPERSGGVAIGLYREGGQAATESSTGYGLVNTGDWITRSMDTGNNTSSSSLPRMLSSNQPSSFQANHQAPVRMGVTVGWQFAPHLSLSSGRHWTSLTSTWNEDASGVRTATSQNLGYLGVPLRLEAHWQPWSWLRLWAGAGGMGEIGLLGTAETDTYIGGHLEGTVRTHPDMGGMLWSVGANAGVEYRIGSLVGLYMAPGIEYHFDNGSTVRSAYTEKPLHWNLSLGLRFHFGE